MQVFVEICQVIDANRSVHELKRRYAKSLGYKPSKRGGRHRGPRHNHPHAKSFGYKPSKRELTEFLLRDRPAYELVTSENRYGTRFWFACPRCGRRVGKLYVPPGRHKALCRHCHRLRYLRHCIQSNGNYRHWQAYWLHRWEKANARLERGYLRGRKKDFWSVKRWEAGKNLFREGILRWDGRRRKAFQVVTLHDLLTRSV